MVLPAPRVPGNVKGDTMTMTSPRNVVDRYFAAQQEKDFATMRTLVQDDISFKGALGATDTAEDYINGIKQMTATMTGMKRHVIAAEGDEVLQIYDLILAMPPVTLTVAQWFTVRDGRIAALRVYFDPRPLFEKG
jgi:ketosteroid isomerase-like protein